MGEEKLTYRFLQFGICVNSIYPTAGTTTSHIHPYTTDYLHHINNINSITTSITTFTPIISPNNHAPKIQKNLLAQLPSSSPNKHIPKRQKNPLISPFPKFASTDIRLKGYKKSPLSIQHHETSFTTHPTTSSISTTTKKPPNTMSLFTINKPLLNSPPSLLLNKTTPSTTINTTTPTTTINTTTTTQTEIPSYIQLNIPLPPRFCTPSTTSRLLEFLQPHMLQELQQSRLWVSPPLCLQATQGSDNHFAFLKTTILYIHKMKWKIKNHIHMKKVGHTSKFLFGIYWWAWKTTIYLKKWANTKQNNFNINNVAYFFLEISLL